MAEEKKVTEQAENTKPDFQVDELTDNDLEDVSGGIMSCEGCDGCDRCNGCNAIA